MPIYHYKATEKVKGKCRCKDGFDILQSMSEKPLKKCPECGVKIKKVPSKFSGGVALLSDGNLRDKGFTKLVKKDKGVYEKTT